VQNMHLDKKAPEIGQRDIDVYWFK
jgi:hypothetical protein